MSRKRPGESAFTRGANFFFLSFPFLLFARSFRGPDAGICIKQGVKGKVAALRGRVFSLFLLRKKKKGKPVPGPSRDFLSFSPSQWRERVKRIKAGLGIPVCCFGGFLSPPLPPLLFRTGGADSKLFFPPLSPPGPPRHGGKPDRPPRASTWRSVLRTPFLPFSSLPH